MSLKGCRVSKVSFVVAVVFSPLAKGVSQKQDGKTIEKEYVWRASLGEFFFFMWLLFRSMRVRLLVRVIFEPRERELKKRGRSEGSLRVRSTT